MENIKSIKSEAGEYVETVIVKEEYILGDTYEEKITNPNENYLKNDIDAELLIELVEARPVLWDKFLDIYKDKTATRNGWHEVCLELLPDFDTLDVIEKNAFAKQVISKWANLRDSFLKYKKRIKASKKKLKKYVYFEEMKFLTKVYEETENMDKRSEQMVGQAQKRKIITKPDEVLPRFSRRTISDKPCAKMSFLQSIMPHLQKFDDEEFLQFQIDILKVIGLINEKKKANPTSSYLSAHHQSSTCHQSYISNPSTSQYQSQPRVEQPITASRYFSQFTTTAIEESPSVSSLGSNSESIDFVSFDPFRSKGALTCHSIIHTGERPYECKSCSRRFFKLKRHTRTHERRYKCTECKEAFLDPIELKNHMTIHPGKLAYHRCTKVHMRIHSGERPYKCTICGKYFRTHGGLQSHSYSHSGQRPHKCVDCEKTFSEAARLKNHMRKHDNQFSYRCTVCEKDYKSQISLKNHMRTHSDIRRYKCEICEKDFRTRDDLKAHK